MCVGGLMLARAVDDPHLSDQISVHVAPQSLNRTRRHRSSTVPQSVLVTGASSGIAAATARLFHARGFTVFGTTRVAKPVSTVEFTMLSLDVTSDTSVRDGIDRVVSQTGRIDILVNNAGYALNSSMPQVV